MKTILFINGHLNAGGCERSLVDVLKNIDYNKFKVDLLLLEELGDYETEIPKDVNIQLYSLKNSFGSFGLCVIRALKNKDMFSFVFRLVFFLSRKINRKALKLVKPLFKNLQKSYDVIVAYRPGICTEMAAYTFKGKKKISWWHHGEMNFEGVAQNELHKSYYHMDRIVAVSQSSAKLIMNTFPDVSNKVCIIPNMICVDELKMKATMEEQVLKSTINQFMLVSVGRMSHEKNMKFCIEIANCLRDSGIRFKWYLIGDGEEYEEIKKLIQIHDLQQELITVGRKTNPYSYIAAADVMLHPSLVESYGITILESMALRTPVVVVESEGPKEFIENKKNGVLVKPNKNIICEEIMKFYINAIDKDRMIEEGLVTVEQFSGNAVMKKIERLLEG